MDTLDQTTLGQCSADIWDTLSCKIANPLKSTTLLLAERPDTHAYEPTIIVAQQDRSIEAGFSSYYAGSENTDGGIFESQI